MVKEGSRIGIIPKICMPENIPNVQILTLEPALKRGIGLASLTPFADLPPAHSAFTEIARKWVENNIAEIIF